MRRAIFSILLVMIAAPLWGESVEMFPGITYDRTVGVPAGKWVFLLENPPILGSASSNGAAIYQADAKSGKAVKLCDCPTGTPHFSRDGNSVCVEMQPGKSFVPVKCELFVFAAGKTEGRALSLDGGDADEIVVGDGHLIARVSNAVLDRVYDYDFASDTVRPIEELTKRIWGRAVLTPPSPPAGCTNIVDFYHTQFGDAGGLEMLVEHYRQTRDTLRRYDGKFVFFEGEDGPREGRVLAQSSKSWDQVDWDDPSPEKSHRKVLKKFGGFARLFNEVSYHLTQVSADGRFALVREDEGHRKGARNGVPSTNSDAPEDEDTSWVRRTYYWVDLATGKAKVVIKDEAERLMRPSLTGVRWFAGAN